MLLAPCLATQASEEEEEGGGACNLTYGEARLCLLQLSVATKVATSVAIVSRVVVCSMCSVSTRQKMRALSPTVDLPINTRGQF